ncbi:MAG: WYL domain-containing protein, partial [Deltaproteobacteria bacterium]|nr:WYL domain-containing protein [Deltaproteobacteria bacterium]
GVELSFTANHLFEVTRWVLSWGAGAEVLDPPELREQVRKEHETALERYAKPS